MNRLALAIGIVLSCSIAFADVSAKNDSHHDSKPVAAHPKAHKKAKKKHQPKFILIAHNCLCVPLKGHKEGLRCECSPIFEVR